MCILKACFCQKWVAFDTEMHQQNAFTSQMPNPHDDNLFDCL